MYQIAWTKLAKETHQQIFDFVLENWSINVVIRFDEEVQGLLQNLKQHKHLCPPLKGRIIIRKCVISPHVSLLYRVNEQNQVIEF